MKFLDSGGYGPIQEARRQTLAAGIAATEARAAEAMPLYREALANWRASHSVWDEAMTGMDMALLLDPNDPEVAEVIASTRAILERLRAQPYLDRLDALAAAASGSAAYSARAARPSGVAATTT